MIQVNKSEPVSKRAKFDSTMNTGQPELATGDDKCYVCDCVIVGKKYSLASCMTNGTKVRLVEVLGRLVCDNYMVVVSHSDYICRGCANLLNTLDRLEAEISSVKRIVLNFVERKYKLGDKVQNQLTPTPVVYSKTIPSVTSSSNLTNLKTYLPATIPKNTTTPSPIAAAKKTTPLKQTPLATQNIKSGVTTPIGNTKSGTTNKTTAANSAQPNSGQRNVWMQCNQCQYTTNQRAVMLEHLRQHVASKSSTAPQTKVSATELKTNGTPTGKSTGKPGILSKNSGNLPGKPGILSGTLSGNSGTPGKSGILSGILSEKTGNFSGTTGNLSGTSGTPTGTPKPSTMITIDGKLAPLPNANKPTIMIKKPANSPGIVTKMLSPAKNIIKINEQPSTSKEQLSEQPSTSTEQLLSDVEMKDVTQQQKVVVVKPKELPTILPKVFSSVKKSAIPDPSMPLLLADDDILSQTDPL